ncbi:MAG TPA: polysaccharide biosynthesis tyrosine autokinase [Chloroflexi bacterium]|nr:polysaccharide biosynthesis tyrosine autokinase [Chloroflexota bacterium]
MRQTKRTNQSKMGGNTVRYYLKLIFHWWWLLIIGALIPGGVSYQLTSQKQDFYQAAATVMVGSGLQNPDPDLWQLNLSNTLAAAYAELVRQGPVTSAVIERLGLERSPEQLAEQIGTRIYSGAQLLEIQVTDTDPEAAALIANALADELIRRSPASGGSDPAQQEFIRRQLEELQMKVTDVNERINALTTSLADLTSAAEIQDAQDRIAALEEVKNRYQMTYANLLDSYQAESPNVLSLFEPAVPPQWPIASKTKLIVAIASMAGVGLALGAIFLMEYLDTSLRWEEAGTQSILEMPVLGVIPQQTSRKASLIFNPLSPVSEGVRTIQANIFLMRPDHPFKTLLLTSPGISEGKSFVLANLAVVLAAAGNRVIVVDSDMRRPTLHEYLDRPNAIGLADVLRHANTVDAQVIPLQETDYDGLMLLTAGRPPVDPATLLTSPRFQNLLAVLSQQSDVVLVDSPPVIGPPDATVIATLVEGTILVASVGQSRRELIEQARDRLLRQPGVHLLGITVNRVKSDGNYRYYGGATEKIAEGQGDGWLTLKEAAQQLGVSKEQARRWRKSGRLPAVRKGLRWLVDPADVTRMLEDTLEIKV